ncbi:MAG: DUF134 domain-containing protein [Dehalococcoidia bacterium]|nr:DUF134 domain-containing protein [Dehalococcoidia bacterium]
MPRPRKCRRIAFMPGINYYKPAGVPLRFLNEVCLSFEELESVRLKDLEDLDQEQSAERMNISRSTFQRILESARKKIADALLNGKAIRIEGGNFETLPQRYVCENGHQWDVPLEQAMAEPMQTCPVCSTTAPASLPEIDSWGRGRGGRCHRGGLNR